MGADCTIYSPSGSKYLDRWHNFSGAINNSEIMDRAEVLRRMDDLLRAGNSMHWIECAIEFINTSRDDKFSFVHDNSEEYDEMFGINSDAAACWNVIQRNKKEEA